MVVNRFGIADTPYQDLTYAILLFIFITLGFVFFANKDYLKIWFIKAFVTLIVMLGYEANYGLDAYMYFAEAVHSLNVYIRPGTGTYNVAMINHFFTYIAGDSYHSLKLLNSFIGYLGLLLLYKSFEYTMQKSNLDTDPKYIYFFFLFPSVLFWSSILGKDPLTLFFIGLFSYGFIHLIDDFKLRYIIMIAVSIWLISYIRSWWSIIMVTTIFLYYLRVNSMRSFIFFIMISPIFYILAVQFLHTQGISSFEQVFLKMTETSSKLAYGSGSISTQAITGIGDYVLYYIPNLFTSLYRPMPWDIRNLFTALAAIENVLLFYLTYKYIFKNWKLIYNNKYLKFFILLIFSWSLLYVIISPTNLGVAVRFKLQVLPAMLILIGAAIAMSKQKEKKLKADL